MRWGKEPRRHESRCRCSLRRHAESRESEFEMVGMFSFGIVDGHFFCDTDKLTGAGIGDDSDARFWNPPIQRAAMLQGEGTDAGAGGSTKSSGDALDSDITGRAFGFGGGGKHLAFAGGFEIAVESFVEGQKANGGVADLIVLSLGGQLDFECSGGVSGHASSLLSWSGLSSDTASGLKAERNNAGSDARSRSHACIVVWRLIWRQPRVSMVSPFSM